MATNQDIIDQAIHCLQIEQDTIKALQNSIDKNYCEVVRLLLESSGRLVVCGLGKSALVSQKLVATFNSTGTRSIFMHAADAIHGDLGMLDKDDILLCISKSGDTGEFKVLMPIARNLGCRIIGMTANVKSYIGTNSDYVLLTPIQEEADPNNLAPTASTTSQIALGDAIAISLLSLRGFKPEHFAKFHPGGSLGKQISLRVRDLLSTNGKPAVQKEDSISETIMEMTSKRLGATAVLVGETIIGMITDGDLRRMIQRGDPISEVKAGDIMNASPKTIEVDKLGIEAFNLMKAHNINQLIVTEDQKYLGMVHIHDMIDQGFV